MDVSLTLTEEEEVFFMMTDDCHCCVNTETETIYFDFSDFHVDSPRIIDIAEQIGLYLKRYESYMTLYDLVLYCMIHEPLHCAVARLDPCVDYCPVFNVQWIVDTSFLDDMIMEDLGIKLFKPNEKSVVKPVEH